MKHTGTTKENITYSQELMTVKKTKNAHRFCRTNL